MDNAKPPKPSPLPVDADHLPGALKAAPIWVVWRYEWKANKHGGGQWTKPPRQPNGRLARVNDAKTWCGFPAALAAYRAGADGIGAVMRGGLVGIDLDHVLDAATGEVEPWAQAILARFAGGYIERSPGGDGFHILCQGTPAHSGKAGPGNRLEVYGEDSPRYLTMTGQTGGQGRLQHQQAALDWLHAEYWPAPSQADGRDGASQAKTPPAKEQPRRPAMGRTRRRATDDEVIQKARKGQGGERFAALFDRGEHGGDASAADLALCNRLAYWCDGDAEQVGRLFRRSALMRDKWDEAHAAGGETYGAMTLAKALAGWAQGTGRASTEKAGEDTPGMDMSHLAPAPASPQRDVDEPALACSPYYFQRHPDGGVEGGQGLALEDKAKAPGLYHVGVTKTDPPLHTAPQWVCQAFELLASCDDGRGHGHGLAVRFTSRHGHTHTWTIPRALLVSDGLEMFQKLMDMGFSLSIRNARAHLREYLNRANPAVHALSVSKTGWANGHYVLPDAIFGAAPGTVFYQSDDPRPSPYSVAGRLDGWRSGVALPLAPFDLPVFALACAFAAPLLSLFSIQTGGFHITGTTSTGKSTVTQWALSPWGDYRQLRQTWSGTAVGFEMTAAKSSDAVLLLDEIGQATDPKDVGSIVYLLANEAGKLRGDKRLTARAVARWALLVLSSGEKTPGDVMLAGGQPPMAGQELRLVNLPADGGDGCGILNGLAERAEREALIHRIDEATRRHHGHPIRAYLQRLTQSETLAQIEHGRAQVEAIAKSLAGDAATSEIARVALRFAVVAYAGELASQWGITGWPAGRATTAAQALFDRWLSGWGIHRRDETHFLARLDEWLSGNLAGHFAEVDGLTLEITQEAAQKLALLKPHYGYVATRNGERHTFLNAAGWAAVTKHTAKPVAVAALARSGRLVAADGPSGRGKNLRVGDKASQGRYVVIRDGAA